MVEEQNMKNYPLMKLAVLFVSALVLSHVNCTRVVSDGGTETGNPSVSAMLYNPGGSPAAHAKVRFFPVNYNPRTGGLSKALAAVVESTVTNAQGNYTAKLDIGAYNILATGDSGVVYQDSITVIKDSTIHPPTDTLGAPGGLRGRVRLQAGDDARTVFILFLGTNTWVMPDDSIGRFTVANMAGGTYRVRFLTTLDSYLPKDTVLSVTAGKADSLGHDVVMQYTGIPVVMGLRISYDTLKQIVTVMWNRPTAGRKVAGYDIYRKEKDSTSFIEIKSGVKDTVYMDSTGVQDLTYEYRVTAVDTNGTEGVKSAGQTVTISGLYSFVLSFGPEGSTGGFASQHGICFGQDSVILVADYQNSKIKRFTIQGRFLDQFGTTGTGVGQFDHVLDVAMDDSGYIYTTEYNNPRIQKFNAQGNFIKTWQIPDGGAFTDLVVCDSFIYTTYVYSNKIECYSLNGDSLKEFDLPTDYGTYSLGGWDITSDKQGHIYVSLQNKVYVLNNNGTLIKSFPLVPGGTTDPEPRCIAIDTTGNILVACLSDMLIRVYDQNGNYLAKWGAAGTSVGQFTSLSSMIIAPDNSAFVSDGDLGRIQKFIQNK
jgi:hypothetical protein